MSNWEDSGGTGSSPWISSSGEIAHPDSPRGGLGPGRGVRPGPLGAGGTRSDVLPNPQSPAGRRVLVSDIRRILLAQNAAPGIQPAHGTSTRVQARRPVVFAEFNNKGKAKFVKAIKGNEMGVHPPHNFAFVNAVELIFKVDEKLAKKMGIRHYRCRQRVHMMEVWEKEFRDHNVTSWSRTMSGGAEPDDPDEGLQKTTPPILAFHDAPGPMARASDVQLPGPGGKMTSKTAVAVFLRQNFIAWIEGARGTGKHKTWQPVSDEVKWHSNQSLVHNFLGAAGAVGVPSRAQPVPGPWWVAAAEGCEIELGHTQGQPK